MGVDANSWSDAEGPSLDRPWQKKKKKKGGKKEEKE